MKVNTGRNCFLLFLTASIWGLAFVFQSKGMEYMDPFTFNGVRSLIGAVSLLLFVLVRNRITGRSFRQLNKKLTWKAGISCGIVLTIASSLQQFGIMYTTVGKAGFITTLYIIFVPIAGLFFRKKVSGVVWIAAGMSAIGMYLLCMTESLSFNPGDVLVFLCAVAFTIHIMVIDYFSPKGDGVVISCIQFFTCGILSAIVMLVTESPSINGLLGAIGPILYAGVLSSGVAYTLQVVAQKDVNPTVASLILCLESVFSAIAGWLILHEIMSLREWLGCGFMFVAIVLAQIPMPVLNKKRKERNV